MLASGRAGARRARCPARASRRAGDRSGRRRPPAPMPRPRRRRAGSRSPGIAPRRARPGAGRAGRRRSPRRTAARRAERTRACARVFRPIRSSAKQPFSSVITTLRAPISAIASSAIRKSSSSSSSWPTSCSASRLVRGDEERAGLDAELHRLSFAVQDDAHVTAHEISDRVRIELRRHLPRERAGEDDEVRAAREVVQLLHQHVELRRRDLGAPLVDLRVRARGRVDHRRRGARLPGDADEVVEDRLGGQLLHDSRAGASSGQPRRDDRDVEELERARDVDALAACKRQDVARAMAVADLEHGHGQRPVERGVGSDGDDHVTMSQRFSAVRSANHAALPSEPGSETEAAAIRFDDATRRSPSQTSTRPSRSPFRTGSATIVGTTVRSRSGTPSLTVRRSDCGATSSTSALGRTRCRLLRRRDSRRSPKRAGSGRARTRAARAARRFVLRATRRREPSRRRSRRRRDAAAASDQPASSRVTRLPADERGPAREEVVGGGECCLPASEYEVRSSASRMEGTPSA